MCVRPHCHASSFKFEIYVDHLQGLMGLEILSTIRYHDVSLEGYDISCVTYAKLIRLRDFIVSVP